MPENKQNIVRFIVDKRKGRLYIKINRTIFGLWRAHI